MMWFGKPVPRTNILADIATENPVFKFTLYFFRNSFFKLYCIIADALASVYLIRFRNGIRRTGIHTPGTGAAMVGLLIISRQLKVRDDFPDKKEAAVLPVDEVAVFAYPAKSAFLRPHFIHNRC